MEAVDLILVPLYLAILYALANFYRPKVTNKITKKYFLPALTVKFIGSLGVGFIYFFYYTYGGDTVYYYLQSKVILQAFLEDPIAGFKILMASGKFDPTIYRYTSQMHWYESYPEFIIVKITAIFSLLGLGSYSVAALFFAIFSFTGIWALYLTFLKIQPKLHKEFAIAVLFLPSVFFWGSGVLKDSITLGFLGWLFFGFYSFAVEKKDFLKSSIIIILAVNYIYFIKVYILLAFLPPALLWIFNENNARIKNALVRNLLKPLFFVVGGAAAYFIAITLTAGDVKYDVTKIAERTEINNKYLSTQIESGSAYTIDTFDGSLSSILNVAPTAITVSLFRPFLWEVRSPIMLLSAVESFAMLLLTLKIFFKVGILNTFKLIGSEPIILFCVIFSVIFAFAVGTNSGNFGTLVRYKIPLMPFYLSALFIMEAKVREKSTRRKTAKALGLKPVS
jgi:hypothetical protein